MGEATLPGLPDCAAETSSTDPPNVDVFATVVEPVLYCVSTPARGDPLTSWKYWLTTASYAALTCVLPAGAQ